MKAKRIGNSITMCTSVFLASLLFTQPLAAQLLKPVKTESGLVAGVKSTSSNVVSFKGIPYAAPPVGEWRWREPQPPVKWEGTRKADKFC